MSFIFQAIPERYDLRERLEEGKRVAWVASRYMDQMKVGEVVYFWLAGNISHRGLYGWGKISGAPVPDEASGYRVEVQYRRNFLAHEPRRHIPSETVAADPVLGGHLLFRMPIGTNFLLTDQEDTALRNLIGNELGQQNVPT